MLVRDKKRDLTPLLWAVEVQSPKLEVINMCFQLMLSHYLSSLCFDAEQELVGRVVGIEDEIYKRNIWNCKDSKGNLVHHIAAKSQCPDMLKV